MRRECSRTPQSGADFVSGAVIFGYGKIFPGDLVHVLAVVLRHGHDDAIAGADIMEEEVAIGVKLLFTERGRDGESAAVDLRADGSSRQRLDVTNIAAD